MTEFHDWDDLQAEITAIVGQDRINQAKADLDTWITNETAETTEGN